MHEIAKSDVSRIPQKTFFEMLPCIVTVEGKPAALIVRPEDVVIISEMHPMMRVKIKALEELARAGQLEPEKVI